MSEMTRGPRGPAGTTGTPLAAAVGAGLALLAGPGAGVPAADAAIVVHLNPAPGEPEHFQWANFGSLTSLDVTLPASSQPGLGPAAIGHDGDLGAGIGALGSNFGLVVDNLLVVGHAIGDPIGPATTTWDGSGFAAHPAFGVAFSEETTTYLGLRFDLGNGLQYGWIGVTRSGPELDAFAWGYETEPGVLIAAGAGIPSPGAAALLGLTGLVVGCRRRRRGASGAAGARLVRRGRIAAPLAAVAMAMVAVPAVDAATVVHVNPGHFEWFGGVGPNAWVWLDLTLPAASQATVFSSSSVGQNFDPDAGVSAVTGDAQVSIDPSFFAIGHEFGEPIDASLTWDGGGVITWPDLGPPAIPEGEERYLGVRFDVGSGDQFGWIGVIRTGTDLDAFAWGYETEPGVPIAAGAGIPSPGAAALLGLTGLAGCQRRRRP